MTRDIGKPGASGWNAANSNRKGNRRASRRETGTMEKRPAGNEEGVEGRTGGVGKPAGNRRKRSRTTRTCPECEGVFYSGWYLLHGAAQAFLSFDCI